MPKLPEKDYNVWLEDVLKYLYSVSVDSIGIVALQTDGQIFSRYYNAGFSDKAIMSQNIQMDMITESLEINYGITNDTTEEDEEGDEE